MKPTFAAFLLILVTMPAYANPQYRTHSYSRRYHSERRSRPRTKLYHERRSRSASRSATRHRALLPRFGRYTGIRHGREQRSEAAKDAFKREHPCPSTGQGYGPCKGYVVDHVKPLACGGADNPGNMQWQTVAESKAKDQWERKGCR